MSAGAGGVRDRHVLVSAGPTFEDIDPVRFIGNRSSGRMGFAVAEAMAAQGARVTLVAGPVQLATPACVRRIDVRSAAQMHAAVLGALPAEVYVGAAAVADFTPARVAGDKLKKTADGAGLVLELVRTADILADVAAHALRPRLVVGFAAETRELARYATDKLQRKRVDMICANDVSRPGLGFESGDNALAVFWNGGRRDLGPAPKAVIAEDLVRLIQERLADVA